MKKLRHNLNDPLPIVSLNRVNILQIDLNSVDLDLLERTFESNQDLLALMSESTRRIPDRLTSRVENFRKQRQFRKESGRFLARTSELLE